MPLMASPRLYGEVGVVDDQRVLDEYVSRVLKVGTSGLLLKHASRDQVTEFGIRLGRCSWRRRAPSRAE